MAPPPGPVLGPRETHHLTCVLDRAGLPIHGARITNPMATPGGERCGSCRVAMQVTDIGIVVVHPYDFFTLS